jgi:hypothetical protein
MVADEQGSLRAVEPWRVPDFESRARDPHNISEKQTLRPVVLSRIDERSQ